MKKFILRVILPLVVFAIIVMYLYNWPFYKVIDYWIPVDIKKAIEGNNLSLLNANITDEFFKKYLSTHIKEFRCPLIKDLLLRVRYRFFGTARPVILVHQVFYSHIYHNAGGINYLTIPVITLKNIGKKTAIITKIDIDIDSKTKHNYDEPNFIAQLPLELFPNEEILLFYGQEIPPVEFKSEIDIKYEDLKNNKYKLRKAHRKQFLYDFNRKLYQFLL